jgi:hypothetical protein
MAKTRLLQAVCTVAILAAAPAFAQTNMPTGDTAAGGAANNPTAHEAMPNSTMAPADRMGSPNGSMGGMGSHAAMDNHSTHRTAMAHTPGAMHGRSDASQDAAVDQLNEQSFQAARSGQAYNGGGSGGMTAPGGSGSMNDMHGGSMPGGGRTGGDGGGGGGSGSGSM